jgi:hypothetical protein
VRRLREGVTILVEAVRGFTIGRHGPDVKTSSAPTSTGPRCSSASTCIATNALDGVEVAAGPGEPRNVAAGGTASAASPVVEARGAADRAISIDGGIGEPTSPTAF